ncbi:MAG: YybS family protein, partial [Pseudomonadota bacterium]
MKVLRDCRFIEPMKINDVLGCVCSAGILLFASAWIPFIGPFFSLLTPLPFLYYATKLGLLQGLKVVAASVVIIGLIAKVAGAPQIIFLCLEFSLLGLIISEIYRRGQSFGFTVFYGTGLMLLVGAVILSLISLSRGMGPLDLILGYFKNNLNEAIGIYENSDMDHEKITQLREYAKIFTYVISKIYPALVVVGTGLVVWLNVLISKPLFRMGKLKYPEFGPLDRWRAPETMVWGVIAAGFSLFLSVAGVKYLAINALIVMLVIYVFHGLSIVLFLLNKYRVPQWMRVGAYFLILFQQ